MPWWGCLSCLELDQVENNLRVTLLPPRVTDRNKWEKADDIPCVQEKIMAKPQKILCFVQRQRKKRFLLPKDTRKLVVIDEEDRAPAVFLPAQACEVSAASCGPREFFAVLFSAEALVSCLFLAPQRHEVVVIRAPWRNLKILKLWKSC